ncbi:carbohydrate-binding module family 1 protein [Tulasnella calospora MUT 4182]|uniref:AA9 family lytic polysaccharide monooxygenase n=1 Tax=Tulasnella calospora MUT 4182 TaxID=1051891 RepID=A0A0C3MF73_9AGAM|nr:carbohydrate-binding module family 1 protein [Tulasnella calospora MUT 4182]
MKLTSTVAALAGLIATANAHATFQYFWTDATTSTNTCVRPPPSNSPVGTMDAAMSCNVNGDTGVASKCTVAAGSTVSVEMHQQPGDRTCTTEAIGGNHDGPVIVYLAKVADSSTAAGSSASFFKISQSGLITADATTQTYYWATDAMNDNCGKVSFTIPSDIAPGDYLLRAEVIALHVAGSSGGAQHYMSCYQLTITGGGSKSPAGVAFPGAYSLTDPGILFNLYTSFTTYTIPGPTVYTPGGSSPTTTTKSSSSTTTTKTSSTSTTTTKTSSTSTTTSRTSSTTTTTSKSSTTTTKTTTASGALQTLYGQCGGTGWTGPTAVHCLCESNGSCSYHLPPSRDRY